MASAKCQEGNPRCWLGPHMRSSHSYSSVGPIRSCNGSSKRPSSCTPFRAISSVTSTCSSGNSMRYTRYCASAKPGRAHGTYVAHATTTVVVHQHPRTKGEPVRRPWPKRYNDTTGLVTGHHRSGPGSTGAVQVGPTESWGTPLHHRFPRAHLGSWKLADLRGAIACQHDATPTLSPPTGDRHIFALLLLLFTPRTAIRVTLRAFTALHCPAAVLRP